MTIVGIEPEAPHHFVAQTIAAEEGKTKWCLSVETGETISDQESDAQARVGAGGQSGSWTTPDGEPFGSLAPSIRVIFDMTTSLAIIGAGQGESPRRRRYLEAAALIRGWLDDEKDQDSFWTDVQEELEKRRAAFWE